MTRRGLFGMVAGLFAAPLVPQPAIAINVKGSVLSERGLLEWMREDVKVLTKWTASNPQPVRWLYSMDMEGKVTTAPDLTDAERAWLEAVL